MVVNNPQIPLIFDPRKANEELGWSADKDLKEMCSDMWNWQVKNPSGYEG